MVRNAELEARRYAVLMSRYKSVLNNKLDDRSFAVRMRIATESGGRLPRFMEVHEFLRKAGQHAVHTASPGLYFYAEDPSVIIDCINEFDLKLLNFKKERS